MQNIRNIAIIAHVDHGKTTMVDRMIYQARLARDNEKLGELILDNNDLERVRMLISLLPAFVVVAVSAALIYTSPKTNEYFVYLYAWQYVMIFIGMILLTVRVTYRQIRKLFGQSVKKALKGVNKE